MTEAAERDGTGTGRPTWLSPADELELLAEVGRGAQAVVYRARRHGVEYAVKRPVARGNPVELIRDVRREAALLARVHHPGLPRVFHVGTAAGGPYLVLELLDGTSLAAVLDRGPLAEQMLVRLGMDLASILGAVHRIGLVHRDVKPSNIVLAPDGAARLLDFGLAARGQREYTDVDVTAGTFDYSAPEQAGILRRAVDRRADLYALGVVLFECATGTRPFVSDDVGELIRMHATAEVPDVRARHGDLSERCAAVIGRLLAKDPDDRFQSADELWRALAVLGPGADLPAPPVDDGVRLVGRERERADLLDAWAQARTGVGGIVVVAGGTGTGKSTLAATAAAAARADGAIVLTGKCDADDPVPLAPLRTAVDRYVRATATAPDSAAAEARERIRAAAGDGAGLLAPLSTALAAVLDAPELSAEDRSDQLATALADFLVQLARTGGGLLLHLDDIQWADPATRRVLRRLAADLGTAPLLLVGTARDGEEHQQALDAFRADAGDSLHNHIQLRPLSDEQVSELVSAQLAGSRTTPELVEVLAARSAGNPFAILEYLHALIDAGALRPQWGTWQLDQDVLATLALPDDVLDLILRRIDALGSGQRQILAVAAAVGSRFRPGVVAAAAGVAPDDVLTVVREAIEQRLLDGGDAVDLAAEVCFVHDRIREALLRGQDESGLRRVHQAIATALDAASSGDAADVYALAGHYAAGETDREPGRVFETGWAAGRLALAENATRAAVAFLEPAAAAARAAGIELDSGFSECLGQAYLRTGRVEAAERELRQALARTADPLARAGLLLALALAQRLAWNIDGSLDSCRQGLAEIGYPMPRRRLALVVGTLWTLLLTVVTGKLGLGRLRPGRTPARTRERIRLRAALNLVAAHSCGVGYLRPMLPFFSVRAGWPAVRLGPSPEYVQALIMLGMPLYGFRQLGRAGRVFARAHRLALDELGDPKLAAEVSVMQGLGIMVARQDDGQTWYRRTEEQRRWLDPGLYLNGVTVHCYDLVQRGYPRAALQAYAYGMTLVATDELPAGLVHRSVEVMAKALLGEAGDAVAALEDLRHNGSDDPARLVTVVLAAVQCAYERGDVDDGLAEAVTDFNRLGLAISGMYSVYRGFFAYHAYGLLAQCGRAAAQAPDELPDRLAAARDAVRLLGRAANTGLLRGHHAVARASLLQLQGRPRQALALLVKAEPATYELDAPALGYEMARVRARALRAIGADAEAERQAAAALALANRYGWRYRAGWVRAEFGVADGPTGYQSHRGGQTGTASSDRFGRRLAALQQVSLAASRVLDPHELARVALDQTLTILGAERAMLFLPDPDTTLRPAVGRDGTGQDLAGFPGYSSTVIDQVAATGKALVVTGTEEGAALGSRSAVVHGLRSIMAAPLDIDGRLLGVVYLDSRVAKGVFTGEDVDILLAITHQVAGALETARAAQLDADVQATRRQRDLAEALRESMTELTATLDPDTVVSRLLGLVCRTAQAQDACLLTRGDDGWAVRTTDASGPLAGDPSALLAAGQPVSATAPAPPEVVELLGPVQCWLSVPVRTRGGAGLLLAGSVDKHAFTEAELDIVAALVEQGATAYDNAVLFSQVRQLATMDSLTGVANRRHFTGRADHQLAIALRNHRPVAAMMVDIDHFKRVNDTYGHGTGDVVIKTVARTIAEHLRDHDILGRLGGEEFAAILPEMQGDPTATGERIRAAVERTSCPGPDGPVRVTVSIGVAELKPGDSLDLLLQRADEALYRAKERGRNQIQTG